MTVRDLHPAAKEYAESEKLIFRPTGGSPQFGLVAEEVEKVNPDLVARDAKGKPYTVRYEAVNAMLLNEFLKQHRQVQDQQKQIAKLTAQLKEQAAQIRKVSDKVEMSRPARRKWLVTINKSCSCGRYLQ